MAGLFNAFVGLDPWGDHTRTPLLRAISGVRSIPSSSPIKFVGSEVIAEKKPQKKPNRKPKTYEEKLAKAHESGLKLDDGAIKYGGNMPSACHQFSPEIFLAFSGDHYKVFSYINFLVWRYPWIDKGKKVPHHVCIAYPYLENATGIPRRTLIDIIADLVAMGCLTEAGADFTRKGSNVFKVNRFFLGDLDTGEPCEPRTAFRPGVAREPRTTAVRGSHCRPRHSGTVECEPRTQELYSIFLYARGSCCTAEGRERAVSGPINFTMAIETLREAVPPTQFKTWIQPLRLLRYRDLDSTVVIGVESRFHEEWVLSHYGNNVRDAFQKQRGNEKVKLEFQILASQKG